MALFFCKRHTPLLRMKSNGVTILKGKYFTLIEQQVLAVLQLVFLVQNLTEALSILDQGEKGEKSTKLCLNLEKRHAI